jgi:hypothetical protein
LILMDAQIAPRRRPVAAPMRYLEFDTVQ